MGMHFGIVAIKSPIAALVGECQALGAGMDPVRSLKSIDEAFDGSDCVIAGETEGSAYLLDGSMTFSSSDADMLAEISRRTRSLIVGCGAETTSGTFWFHAFNSGTLVRMFWKCRYELTAPFSRGEPLPTEAALPLDSDFDGHGIFAALDRLGFAYEKWAENGPFQLLSIAKVGTTANRPLEAALNEHWQSHRLAPEDRPPIRVIARTKSRTGWSQWFRDLFGE